MGHEKLAEARLRAMTAVDPNRLMVTCALVLDLYCPDYGSAGALSKEASLMRTAACYKVDASKITARVTAELSTKRKDRKAQSRNREKQGKGKG